MLATVAAATGAFAAPKTLAICVPLYAEYFKYVADTIKDAMTPLGYSVEIASADNDTQTMINQIENFTTRRPELMYVFPAGDATSFADTVKKAKDAGIKVVISHNYTGPGTATATAMAQEFFMGCMGAKMLGAWVDAAYPGAAPGSVKVLVLESTLLPLMNQRCAGMKLISEKYLRKVDVPAAAFIEASDGLILDKNGKTILNPFYNPKVTLVGVANRTIMSNADAQQALDIAFTANSGANKDIAAVICYSGDAAVGASEKLVQMSLNGTLKADLSKVAVFGADNTPTNQKIMLNSKSNQSVLRGVMTNGDIIGTVIKLLTKLSKGEKVDELNYEPLGYMVPKADYSGFAQVMYKNELPAMEKFF
jgi:ABC-type sugar transport system substrate-binding protein